MSEYGHVGRYTLRCEITRNPCGTDTVAKDSEPDCGPCAAAERIAELQRLLALHESQKCLPGCDSLAHDDKCPVVNPELVQQPPVKEGRCMSEKKSEARQAMDALLEEWDNNPPLKDRYAFVCDHPLHPFPLVEDEETGEAVFIVSRTFLQRTLEIRGELEAARKELQSLIQERSND